MILHMSKEVRKNLYQTSYDIYKKRSVNGKSRRVIGFILLTFLDLNGLKWCWTEERKLKSRMISREKEKPRTHSTEFTVYSIKSQKQSAWRSISIDNCFHVDICHSTICSSITMRVLMITSLSSFCLSMSARALAHIQW